MKGNRLKTWELYCKDLWLSARTDKDVQCPATYLNFYRGKFFAAACHGYHLNINIIKLMSWELSHYPILLSDSIVVIDKWWDGSRDWLCCKKEAERVCCLQGPCKKGSYIICWDELSGSHPNAWHSQVLPIVLDIQLKHMLDTEEVLFYVMCPKLVSGCGGFFLKVNK